MYILHIETSTSVCSVALSKGDILLACQDMTEGMNHTARLAPAIEEMLNSLSLLPTDLNAITVSAGPGSYTGLRVGSSTAKAMAYSLGIKLVAIPTLKALAKASFALHPEARYALPMIDARRKEVYTALYDRTLTEVWPVSSVILDDTFFLQQIPGDGVVICSGDGALKIGDLALLSPNLVVDRSIQCSASHLLVPALDTIEKGEYADPLHFVPYYHKPPNITTPRKTTIF